jgi:alginate O-acetyltransferase complex protein AlgI
MSLDHILIVIAACLVGGRLLPFSWKYWYILVISIVGVFWLQPISPIRNLSFWLPLTSIGLIVLVWAITQAKPFSLHTPGLSAGVVIIITIILIIGAIREFPAVNYLYAERPPPINSILLSILALVGLTFIFFHISDKIILSWVIFISIALIFIIIKFPWLSIRVSQVLRRLNQQNVNLASANELVWIGFSYLAFRLLHVIRDYQSNKLAKLNLADLMSYALFLPSFLAGPIDRSQRFISELNQNQTKQPVHPYKGANKYVDGGKRILNGLFSKFVLADTLSLIALNPQNALEINSSLWTWVALYGYALRIYLDFSGYTDIAIGAGKWLGINLPENFNSPYLKTNLAAFWNSWHITLAQWFRAYFFNPVTRALRIKYKRLPVWGIILLGQSSTMLLIGLWHGISWNFALWGLWHGCGLFINNRWSEWRKGRRHIYDKKRSLYYIQKFGGWFITFNYVTLGWVWFILPDPITAIKTFQHLAGIF